VSGMGTSRVHLRQSLTIVTLLASMASGCALVGKGPAPLDTYELTAPDQAARGRSGRTQILVAEPTALKALDGVNIVIRPTDGSIQYLKGAQWADRLPRIVQARLADAYQKSGAFGGVGKPGEGLAIDYQVLVDVRAFEVRVNGGSRAHIELFAKILNDRNGVVRAAKTFTADAPLSGDGNTAYINALDAAFNDAAAEIVRWTDGTI
jgi:cholesterol transport system auxiliary component